MFHSPSIPNESQGLSVNQWWEGVEGQPCFYLCFVVFSSHWILVLIFTRKPPCECGEKSVFSRDLETTKEIWKE